MTVFEVFDRLVGFYCGVAAGYDYCCLIPLAQPAHVRDEYELRKSFSEFFSFFLPNGKLPQKKTRCFRVLAVEELFSRLKA